MAINRMKIKLFNTLGRKKEVFKPIKKGEVKLYACGPTVYDYAHIGHFRAYVFVDVLRRVLEYNGYKVRHVMNITDVGHLTSDADTGEDKIEKGAKREGKTVWEIAEFYTKDFFDAMKKLNVKKPNIICKATDHIKEQIELIKRLEEKGYTYKTSVGLIYDTSKFKKYADFAKLKLEKQKAGARVEVDPEKKNPWDFALWITNQPTHIMQWDSPWGRGFPGWHIECSAMSMKYLGETFDIHTGGVDHIPVHHTNEIAQSEAATGKKFVRYWLHNEFVLVEGQKMSKSLENIFTMKDIIRNRFDPLSLRYLFLTSHYRSQINFTWDSLTAAQNTLFTLRAQMLFLRKPDRKKSNPKKIKKYREKFLGYINDDLNIPYAISLMWDLIRKEKEINNRDKLKLILDFDKVFGLRLKEVKKKRKILSKEARELIEEREKARKRNDWKKADEIRERLRSMGIILEDTKEGVKWKLEE